MTNFLTALAHLLPVLVVAAFIAIAAWTASAYLAWAKADVERMVREALDEESHDWIGEPPTGVIYGPWALYDQADVEPIFAATAAHIAKHEAAALDDDEALAAWLGGESA